MDNFTATVVSVQEVHNTTLLIRGIAYKVDSYGFQAQNIRAAIECKYQILNAFKSLFFNRDDASLHYATLPTHLTDEIRSTYDSMISALAIYGLLAMKHGISIAEQPTAPRPTPKDGEPTGTTSLFSAWLKSTFQNSLLTNLEHLRQSFGPLDWALFDKDRIRDLLDMYDKHTERLLEDMATNPIGANLGITQAAERQNRVDGMPEASFAPLDGKITGGLSAPPVHGYQIVEYDEGLPSGSILVVLEEHKFNTEKVGYSGLSFKERKDKELQSVRALAWLLRGGATKELSHIDAHGLKSMYTLECKGYMERPAEDHTVLVYRVSVPFCRFPKMMTLHAYIDAAAKEPDLIEPEPKQQFKPSLGIRYLMAYALATTVFSIHSSGWVHGRIWSRGILIFPDEIFDEVRESSLIPYLVGWDAARPREAERDVIFRRDHEDTDTDLEANFHRHPDRYCKSFVPCENKHDIYSLGVVLLEIGLWKTIPALLARPIELVGSGNRALPSATEITNRLSRMARSYDLKREMGERYSKVVQQCLSVDFDVEEDDFKNTVLTSKFRKAVVEPLKYGVLL